jgi:RNA polymerase sigma factor (sigma-70 family)
MATNPMAHVLRHLRRSVLQRPEDSLTDGQLLTCFTERRDEAAFAALVQRHAAMVWGVCRRLLGDDHDAEDAFQATFLVLVRKAASVVPRERVANWLYGVAHTTAVRAKSLKLRRRAKEKQVREMPEPETRPHEFANDLRLLLDAELTQLPAKYRAPVVLCDLEERTIKEAARQLGWPQGTVAGRLARARTMLAKRLARHGLAMSGGALAALLSQQALPAPAAVVYSTIKVALLFAAGRATSGVISAHAAALTEGVLKSMMLTKLKSATTVLVITAASLTALGGGLAMSYPSAEPQAADEKQPAQQSAKETPPAGAPARLVGFVDSGTVADEDKCTAAESNERTIPPAGFMPQQALVRLQKDLLVVRTLEVIYEPITMMVQGRNRVTTYQKNELLKTRSFPGDYVKVYDVKGKRVSKKQLTELLKKETLALISVDERMADPQNLQLFKEGTLLLILPSLAAPQAVYAQPAITPSPEIPTPVPPTAPPVGEVPPRNGSSQIPYESAIPIDPLVPQPPAVDPPAAPGK